MQLFKTFVYQHNIFHRQGKLTRKKNPKESKVKKRTINLKFIAFVLRLFYKWLFFGQVKERKREKRNYGKHKFYGKCYFFVSSGLAATWFRFSTTDYCSCWSYEKSKNRGGGIIKFDSLKIMANHENTQQLAYVFLVGRIKSELYSLQ